jgi:hypothetical protein
MESALEIKIPGIKIGLFLQDKISDITQNAHPFYPP